MANKKKIIRACTVPQSMSFIRGLMPYLIKEYEVVLLSSPGKEMTNLADEYAVRYIDVPMERHISLAKDGKALLKMIKVFRREKPYMVHSMTPKAGLLCMIAGWLTHVPVRIHTFTGLVWPTTVGFKKKVLMLTDMITCACATHIIPEGEGVKNDLVNHHITRKHLTVLGFGNVKGVDMDRFSRRREIIEKAQEVSDGSKFTFLYVGRIVGDKGINELTSSFVRLQKGYASIRLVLVGEFEEMLDPISDAALKEINTNPAIIVAGYKTGDDLLAYYAASDCYVFPSYREGFPNTVMEAGAMGLPSIVTDINGSREIILDGQNGMIIPPKDSDALYAAMKKMLTEDDFRGKLARNARDLIESRYEQGFVQKCLLDYYAEILSSEKIR